MCGRLTYMYTWGDIRAYLAAHGLEFEESSWADDGPGSSYNAAPMSDIPVVRGSSAPPLLHAGAMRWSLTPSWSKTRDTTYSTSNAKSEDAASKPAFRGPYRHRRCVIPASGFYEWKRPRENDAAGTLWGGGAPHPVKQPYYITRADDAPLLLAGLWDRWESADGRDALDSCTILTCAPNAEMATIHDRMPCIIEPDDLADWLDPGRTDPAQIDGALRPAADGLLQMHAVSTRVNSTRNNDAELILRG